MQRYVRVVILALCMSLLATGATSAMAAGPRSVLTGQTSLDPSVCKALKTQLVAAMRTPAGRARADAVSAAQIASLRTSVGSDCAFKTYEVRPGAITADASYVQGYWKYMTLYIGNWATGTIHVDVGMTITGSIATTSGGWGPSCYFQWNTGLFIGGITWCGVWNNGNWYTEPGANYWVNIYPYLGPSRSGWMRYCVEGQGVSCYPWGAMG